MQPALSLTRNSLPRYPSWSEISRRFTGERDCLAALLALEGAEVIAGVKPGNIINVVNRQRPCGRNLYSLWRAHGATLLEATGISALELSDRGNSLLLFVYDEKSLSRLLRHKAVGTILNKCGYTDPGDLAATLEELRARMCRSTFPHEIGIFLGYPLKDVLAFMGSINLPYACQGPWKIYGNPAQSLELASCYRQCRCHMAQRLAACANPLQCLREAA